MPKNVLEERLRWVLPICNKEVSLSDVAKVCPHSKRSLERWVSGYKKHGSRGLFVRSTQPKSHPNETPIRIKERAIELRKDSGLSALKLKWKLAKEGISIHERTIGKIIKKERLTRRYRVRKIQYKYLKAPLGKGELLEIDVKYVPERVGKIRYFQFTAIDCASRWRHLEIYDEQTNTNAMDFLKKVLVKFPFEVMAVKTDNGFIFTNRYNGYLKSSDPLNPRLHSFDVLCKELGINHYLIDPGKPAQNGKVERSHRSDQEMFYDKVRFRTAEELKYKVRLWNMYYNDLEHCGLNGKTPNEMLQLC